MRSGGVGARPLVASPGHAGRIWEHYHTAINDVHLEFSRGRNLNFFPRGSRGRRLGGAKFDRGSGFRGLSTDYSIGEQQRPMR